MSCNATTAMIVAIQTVQTVTFAFDNPKPIAAQKRASRTINALVTNNSLLDRPAVFASFAAIFCRFRMSFSFLIVVVQITLAL